MPAKDWLGVSLSCFHISAALDLHSITPFIREQLTGQLFTELLWQTATDMSVKEIF